jgi:hypothetical protein
MSYAMDRKHLALALLLALPVAACEQAPTETLAADGPQALVISLPGDGVAAAETFEICKIGTDASFDVDIVDRSGAGTANISTTVNVADGECWDVWVSGGAYVDDVTVTENPVPAGYAASWSLDQLDGGVVTTTTGSGAVVTGYTSGVTGSSPTLAGATVTFTNRLIPPPPPEGEGCTPGYWKQEHHFDDWTGYTPWTLFGDVFDDAFPGKTLLDVASQGGGGLKALGRHAVAALLNAASGGVGYAYTEQEVIDMFNDAYNGITDIGDTKDAFAMENEYGAPLCGFPDEE